MNIEVIEESIRVNDCYYLEQSANEKRKGRPPLTVINPLSNQPEQTYRTPEGNPTVWLDDLIIGAIRAFNEKDSHRGHNKNYVSFRKVCYVLFCLEGNLTSTRIRYALGVSRDMSWRLLKVIAFLAPSIERSLKAPRRIHSYQLPLRF